MLTCKNPLLCAIVVWLTAVPAGAVTITIDHNTRYQTIVGFGGEGVRDAQYASDLINDAGVSCLRLDWCGAVNPLAGSKAYWDAGCHTVIGSCWSPPANMKDNGSLNNGGHLLVADTGAFGDFAVQQLQQFRTTYGGEMFALSPQNEPAFSEFYGSCVYDGADLINVMKVIYRKIQAAGLHTKIFLPEDVYDNWSQDGKYWTPLLQDTAAKRCVHALAFHGYTSNGVTPAQMNASTLARMYTMAHTYGWELWQTENDGSGGMQYASDVIACLRYGKVSVYMKYDLTGTGGTYQLWYIDGGVRQLTYYVAKCINKFIRPGAVQLRSRSSDSATYSNFVAFYDSAASALAITLATDATAQSVTLQGVSLPATFQKWVTNAATNCVNQGNVSVGSTIDLPANSVVTLYGTGYTPPRVGVERPNGRAATHFRQATSAQLYEISGRRVSPVDVSARNHVAVIVANGRAQVRLDCSAR